MLKLSEWDILRTALVLTFAHCKQQKASICSLLSVITTFASTFALPLCHIYFCQHLLAVLCHIYIYSVLIMKALKIAIDSTNSCCRCTIRSACQKASQSSPRWLSLGTGQQCIDFEQVLPDRIPINQMTTVRHTFTLPVFIRGNLCRHALWLVITWDLMGLV